MSRAKVRQRARNRRIKALPWDQKLDRAQGFYNNTWNRMSRFYGAQSQPPPNLAFGNTAAATGVAHVTPGAKGYRTVELSPSQVPQMLFKSARSGRRSMQRELAHEWSHVYQSEDMLNRPAPPGADRPRESAADAFADGVMQRLGRKQTLKRAQRHDNRATVRKLKRRYRRVPPPFLDTSQFGSNLGANPQTITYPAY